MRRTGTRLRGAAAGRALIALLACACDGGGGGGDPTVIVDVGTSGGAGGAGGATGGIVGGGGGDDVVPDLGVGGVIADMGVSADAGPDPCPEATGYGLVGPLQAVSEGAKGNHSPRATWTGTEWGVAWFAPSETEADLGSIKFQRFNTMGEPVGTLQDLGYAKVTRFDVAWNGGGYLVAFMGARNIAGEGFPGIRIQALAADGTPVDLPTDLANTFDAERLAFGFAPLTGAMAVYTLGRGGEGGLWAQILGEGGERTGNPVRLSAEGQAANYPAVAYGDGTWGVAWADPSAAMPNQLVFKLLDERGVPQRDASLPNGIAAKGSLYLAYGGSDTFGLAWNQEGDGGILKPKLTLLSASDASVQVSPDVTGPTGYSIVTDIAWHDPEAFGISWQETVGSVQRVGLTRINPLGVSLPPYPFSSDLASSQSSLTTGGTNGNVGAFFTHDPTPSGTGPSEGAQVYLGRLGTCR